MKLANDPAEDVSACLDRAREKKDGTTAMIVLQYKPGDICEFQCTDIPLPVLCYMKETINMLIRHRVQPKP